MRRKKLRLVSNTCTLAVCIYDMRKYPIQILFKGHFTPGLHIFSKEYELVNLLNKMRTIIDFLLLFWVSFLVLEKLCR